MISGYTGNDSDIVIPDEIDGEKVSFLEDNLFYNNQNIKSIKLPNTILSIGAGAFDGNGVNHIYYCGSESDWNEKQFTSAFNQHPYAKVIFEKEENSKSSENSPCKSENEVSDSETNAKTTEYIIIAAAVLVVTISAAVLIIKSKNKKSKA